MKYVYKQHNKWGNPQQRPPPQPQEGPGWGLLYKPQPPRTTATPGTAANSLTPTIGEKEANRLRDRLKEMLSRHLHRDDPTSTHQPHDANPAPHDQPTDPASSSTHDPTTTDVATPSYGPRHPTERDRKRSCQPDTPRHNTATSTGGKPGPPRLQPRERPSPMGRPAHARLVRHASGRLCSCIRRPPPEVPLSDASVGTVTQLSHGCWQLVVSPRPNGPDPKWGRPRQVRLHDWAPRTMGAPHRNTLVLHCHRGAPVVRHGRRRDVARGGGQVAFRGNRRSLEHTDRVPRADHLRGDPTSADSPPPAPTHRPQTLSDRLGKRSNDSPAYPKNQHVPQRQTTVRAAPTKHRAATTPRLPSHSHNTPNQQQPRRTAYHQQAPHQHRPLSLTQDRCAADKQERQHQTHKPRSHHRQPRH